MPYFSQGNDYPGQRGDYYRLLFRKSRNGIAFHQIITDNQGNPEDYVFLDVNDSFELITGLKRSDIIGKRVRQVIGNIENDRTDWIREYGAVALEGKELMHEFFSEIFNKWFSVYAYSPKKRYFIAEFSDITSEIMRRSAESVIKAERQRFNTLFETIPAYLILLSPDYHIPFANKFFRDRFGDPAGRKCFEYLFNRTEPCENCETYKVLQTLKPHEWEWTGPDNRIYSIHDFLFKETDGSVMVLEMGIDITELKNTQGQLAAINENLEERISVRTSELREKTEDLDLAQSVGHIGSWRLELPSNLLAWSEETYSIFGVQKKESLTYDKFLSYVHPDDCDYVNRSWQNALKGEDYNIEHRIIVNGRVKWVIEKALLEFDEDGGLKSAFGIVQDITDRMTMNEKLRRSEEQLQVKNADLTRINEMMEDFVAIAAHDLRSPVSSIKALSALIELLPDINKKLELFRELMQIVGRLERTIDGLVETINIQRTEDIPCKRLEFEEIFNEAIYNLSEQIELSGAELNHEIGKDTSIIYVEAYLLSIFTNMISNALKYRAPRRKPVITVSAEKKGDYHLVSFSDNGMGINLGLAGKDLFKPFKRFTDKAEGKGMGLYIIKNIVERNGGYIEVISKEGQGTTFRCYLKEYNEIRAEVK